MKWNKLNSLKRIAEQLLEAIEQKDDHEIRRLVRMLVMIIND